MSEIMEECLYYIQRGTYRKQYMFELFSNDQETFFYGKAKLNVADQNFALATLRCDTLPDARKAIKVLIEKCLNNNGIYLKTRSPVGQWKRPSKSQLIRNCIGGTRRCIEHPDREVSEYHHIIPFILGGRVVVALCAECHDKIHGFETLNPTEKHNYLIQKGLEERKRLGLAVGRPPLLETIKIDIIALHMQGISIRAIARKTHTSKSTVLRVINEQKSKGGHETTT